MKTICLVIAVLSFAIQIRAQSSGASSAPLTVLTNGAGCVLLCHDGQELQVGRTYAMIAVPDPEDEFENWTEVVVFNFIQFLQDESGNPITRTNTTISETTTVVRNPFLAFTMQPEAVLFTSPARDITMTIGWQANFRRRY